MLHRFCKVCYQVVDESVVGVRYLSFLGKKEATSKLYRDKESEIDNNKEQVNDTEQVKEPKKKRYCLIKCKRSEFDFYKGDTYPKFKPIPMTSRGWHHRKSKGDYFTIFPPDDLKDNDMIDNTIGFKDFDLDEELLKNIENCGFDHPTAIQKIAIPKLLSRDNAALTAETGCGKTHAFIIPIVQQILDWKKEKSDRGFNKPLAIIVTPSKELTVQITNMTKQLVKNLDIKVIKLVGGGTKYKLRNPPIGETDIIVGTVGILNRMVSNAAFDLSYVRHVVLDEADTLLDETFLSETRSLLFKVPIGASRNPNNNYPETSQLTLNSATIAEKLSDALEDIVNVDFIDIVTTGFEHYIRVPQKFFRLIGPDKPQELLKIVKPKAKNKIPIIVFSNTSESCDFTKIFLEQFGVKCVGLHKNMPNDVRMEKINQFQNGQYHVLTTTDAGARGIDTTTAKDIINFDFPLITAEYVHRCGRVGRIGSPKDCRVINFISRPLEIVLTSKIEFAARKMNPIPMVDLIHNKYDEDGQFLHGSEMTSDVHETKLDEEENGNDEKNKTDQNDVRENYAFSQ